jgi:hypothetical protein
MKLKSRKTEIPTKNPWEARPATIISDAAVATVNVGEGRLIPLVIIDSSERPDIEELVRVHEYLPPGDVTVQWGHMENTPEWIALFLRFVRPVEVLLVLNFNIVKQGGIVDQILLSRALYLQSGRAGDRFRNTIDAKRILIDVPETGFGKTWNGLLFKRLVKDFRQRGLPKYQAKEAARGLIEEWRKFGRSRLWGNKHELPNRVMGSL